MAFGWVTLRRSTIAGNRSPVQPGGGLLCFSPVDLEQVILFGNCAPAGGDEAWVYPVGSLSLTCCCTDSSGIEGSGSIEFGSENVFDDPRFCGPLACASAPATGGDYTLDASSPCRDDGNACGVWIGALGIGCQWPTPVEVGSWGRLKQQFR
jgi:hypothetical protein